EVVQMARDGQPDATRLFRQAAAVIGAAVSDIVNTLNPRIVVLGGQLSAADDILFAGIREVVYRRSLPRATRRLQIVPSTLGERVGVHGLARLALDEMFSPTRLADWLRTTQLRDVVRPS
ncbi:MAG: hypothetical protein JWM93_874, partial [Frankiales bacterium]|nr:hypothetical protein [Frankiales bacterium]